MCRRTGHTTAWNATNRWRIAVAVAAYVWAATANGAGLTVTDNMDGINLAPYVSTREATTADEPAGSAAGDGRRCSVQRSIDSTRCGWGLDR